MNYTTDERLILSGVKNYLDLRKERAHALGLIASEDDGTILNVEVDKRFLEKQKNCPKTDLHATSCVFSLGRK